MVEISSSGSGEGPGQGNRPAYSTTVFSPRRSRRLPPPACRSGAQQGVARLRAAWTCRFGWARMASKGCAGAAALATGTAEGAKIVENAYHALAIDEQREPFKPALWEQLEPVSTRTWNRYGLRGYIAMSAGAMRTAACPTLPFCGCRRRLQPAVLPLMWSTLRAASTPIRSGYCGTQRPASSTSQARTSDPLDAAKTPRNPCISASKNVATGSQIPCISQKTFWSICGILAPGSTAQHGSI